MSASGGKKSGRQGLHSVMCEAPARADRKKRSARTTSVRRKNAWRKACYGSNRGARRGSPLRKASRIRHCPLRIHPNSRKELRLLTFIKFLYMFNTACRTLAEDLRSEEHTSE